MPTTWWRHRLIDRGAGVSITAETTFNVSFPIGLGAEDEALQPTGRVLADVRCRGAMQVPFMDVPGSNVGVMQSTLREIERFAREGRFLLGPAVEAFEADARRYLGTEHAIGVSSGSDALVVALQACGVGPGDEVITTPFSFFATVESILRVGARPRFVDIERQTFGVEPQGVEDAISSRTRAILVVHLYGQPANIEPLRRIAERRGVRLIEDCAQAFGARFGDSATGTLGALGCFSFQPTKPLGAWGDAGLVVTRDTELAEKCRKLRVHGAASKHKHLAVGGNYRMDALQAVVLSQKLPLLDAALARRREHACAYDRELAALGPCITTPASSPGTTSSAALYTIRVDAARRDCLSAHLASRGVETAIHYPLPLHRQPVAINEGWALPDGSLQEAEQAAREVLCLPLYPELTDEQRQLVVNSVRSFFLASPTTA